MWKTRSVLSLYVLLVLTIHVQACVSVQPMIQGTPTWTPTVTLTPSLTPTAPPTFTPTITPSPTVTPNLTATQQYEDFIAFVRQIHKAGQISTIQGSYQKLNDFSDELAMEYGYRWTSTGLYAKDFIVRADFEWEVANQKNYSGCGFVFRQESDNHFYAAALDALNGVFFSYTLLGSVPFGGASIISVPVPAAKLSSLPDMGDNPYHATFALIVNEHRAYTYINDVFYSEHNLKRNILTEPGTLAYMVLTGSATDFGTRCKISNVEIWIPISS